MNRGLQIPSYQRRGALQRQDIEMKWLRIKEAIHQIYQQNASSLSFQSLYTAGYQIVLHKHGEYLYNGVTQALREHIEGVRESVMREIDASFLFELLHEYSRHRAALSMVRDILMYLDRNYVTGQKKTPIFDLGVELFGNEVFHKETLERTQRLVMDIIRKERDGEGEADRFLLKEFTVMMIEISKKKIYIPYFEKRFLQESQDYFTREAAQFFETSTATEYLVKVTERLKKERERALRTMDPETAPKIEHVIKQTMIEKYKESIIEKEASGCTAMLQNWKLDDLRLVYDVLGLVAGALKPLVEKVKEFTTKQGMDIVKNEDLDAKPLDMIKQLIDMHQRYYELLETSFSTRKLGELHYDPAFSEAVKMAFDDIVNENERLPEYLSIYLDSKLKKGKNQIAESEVDPLFDKIIALFRHLRHKDLFEKYYKSHLARRLLDDKSQSDEAEKSFITKLKTEFGYQFTMKLEGMFNDMKISRENEDLYKKHMESHNKVAPIDITVQVLTTGCWPVTASPKVAVPAVINEMCESYQDFYTNKHSGRRLGWQFNMGHVDIRANGFERKYELNVSTFQACILMLFNDAQQLSYKDIFEITKIPAAELKRSLFALCIKSKNYDRVLTKSDEGNILTDNTIFSPNTGFKSKLIRVKIAVVRLKETREEVKQTMEKVEEERKHLIEAAVVRIMKMRKSLAHRDLVIEVTKQLQNRFMVDPQYLKQRVESLIERDYLTRDAQNRNTYHYVA